MATATATRTPGQGFRRVAFVAWAATLAALVGGLFVAVTALTVGLWFAGRNADTNPVADLGFFALGGIIIAGGYLAQLRAPERQIAGLLQAVAGLLALGVAGLIGRRVEPLTGAVVLLAATALLIALHPARGACLAVGGRPSLPLAALAALAAPPAIVYTGAMLDRACQAGPSCFLGRCAAGDRFAELAALALAIVALALLAACRPPGWRLTAWSAATAAMIPGAASVAWPGLPGALGPAFGVAALLWGLLFVVVAEREARAAPADGR